MTKQEKRHEDFKKFYKEKWKTELSVDLGDALYRNQKDAFYWAWDKQQEKINELEIVALEYATN